MPARPVLLQPVPADCPPALKASYDKICTEASAVLPADALNGLHKNSLDPFPERDEAPERYLPSFSSLITSNRPSSGHRNRMRFLPSYMDRIRTSTPPDEPLPVPLPGIQDTPPSPCTAENKMGLHCIG